MDKRTNVRVTMDIDVNDVVFDTYQEATQSYPDMLKESYERAMAVRPDLPDQGSTETELFLFWSSCGKGAGSWVVNSQRGDAVQAILVVDNYTVTCNILLQGTTYRMMGWYVHRNPKVKG